MPLVNACTALLCKSLTGQQADNTLLGSKIFIHICSLDNIDKVVPAFNFDRLANSKVDLFFFFAFSAQKVAWKTFNVSKDRIFLVLQWHVCTEFHLTGWEKRGANNTTRVPMDLLLNISNNACKNVWQITDQVQAKNCTHCKNYI